jgi:hypothetical protein
VPTLSDVGREGKRRKADAGHVRGTGALAGCILLSVRTQANFARQGAQRTLTGEGADATWQANDRGYESPVATLMLV